eukprot:6328046-Heterocapsa_arctica.AAC.1
MGVEDPEEISKQVYPSLASLLEGEAFTLLRNVSENNGLEVVHRQIVRWDPQTIGRRRDALSRIIAPGATTLELLSSHIGTWEQRVREHEKRSKK